MREEIICVFPMRIRERIRRISWKDLEEIRVRIGWPVELVYANRTEGLGGYEERMERQDVDEMLNYITGYSVYAMEEELKQGFITLWGGHRVGVTGHAIYEKASTDEKYQVSGLRDIGGFNIRIAHEKKGCAKEIAFFLRNGQSIYNTIFFAAPGVGKTTYLRDTIRILSSGDAIFSGLKCCVIDERSEIGACRMGKTQNDLGSRTDVLDGCPKAAGMKMVLRSMSPQIIAVDELGKKEEFSILEEIRCSGVKILGTMHAGSVAEVWNNPMIQECIKAGTVERFVELIRFPDGKRGYRIYDGKRRVLWEK